MLLPVVVLPVKLILAKPGLELHTAKNLITHGFRVSPSTLTSQPECHPSMLMEMPKYLAEERLLRRSTCEQLCVLQASWGTRDVQQGKGLTLRERQRQGRSR